ncbi:hypothetical protein F5148DRAFT_339064 [Russula earlei]|uniref:Uncharacterized protein n=1 Tax=Russula earlei TaxID=71964 RepID=A0ACC0U1I6_9AGAM|nr:hypothetical protein F5148DRAFT_339064 [Russula earlei]
MSFRLPIRRLRYHVSSLCTGFIQSLLPCTVRSLITIGGPCRASLEASPCEHRQDPVTINTLPDHVLVEIFHFYMIMEEWSFEMNEWHTLVHACQRWRRVMFASPRRLNLRLWYAGKRPMSEMLDVWPVLPVAVGNNSAFDQSSSWENIAVALESEHRHRICQIQLWSIPTSEWERLAAAMQNPFPKLTHLWLFTGYDTVTSLPDSFLGGSAPLLRFLRLENCPFPGLPKVLLSSNQLVTLFLFNIPNSGYISLQDLVTALSVLSRLEFLRLEFRSSRYPARPPPPLTRSVLPALTTLYFHGVHEYLEDLLAQIEVPLLEVLDVAFSMDINFVLPQFHRLISQVESFNSCDRATVHIHDFIIQFQIFTGTNTLPELKLEIRCIKLDWQLASLAQICSSSFPFLSTLVHLDIMDFGFQPHWTDDMETTQWLELLAPFTAMKDLHLTHQVAPHVCQALEELAGERVTEILPALQNIFLEGHKSLGSVPKYIEGFVATRNLSGHPVAVHRWDIGRGIDDELLPI